MMLRGRNQVWIFCGVGALLGGLGVTHLGRLEQRVRRLDEVGSGLPQGMRSLALELERARAEVDSLRDDLDRIRSDETQERTGLRADLERLAGEIDVQSEALFRELEQQSCELRDLEEWSETVGTEFHAARAMEARLASDERWNGIRQEVENAIGLARRIQADLERMSVGLERDESTMWSELVAPSVQLAGTSTVGSGVILRSPPAPEGAPRRTVVITAWHVVRDIFAESSEEDPPIPVTIHGQDGAIRRETATLRAHDVALDVALLELDTDQPPEHGAVLVARERMHDVRTFHEIYAVGCPLGNDPIPTRGEISHTNHRVDDASYWMISAPTYIGNSGGGIFDARSHELMGIFSKIYTHGNLRPTVVPHMGLVTPLAKIYDWIDAGDFAELVPLDASGALTIVLDESTREQ